MKIYIYKNATGNLQNNKVDQKLNIDIQKKQICKYKLKPSSELNITGR